MRAHCTHIRCMNEKCQRITMISFNRSVIETIQNIGFINRTDSIAVSNWNSTIKWKRYSTTWNEKKSDLVKAVKRRWFWKYFIVFKCITFITWPTTTFFRLFFAIFAYTKFYKMYRTLWHFSYAKHRSCFRSDTIIRLFVIENDIWLNDRLIRMAEWTGPLLEMEHKVKIWRSGAQTFPFGE